MYKPNKAPAFQFYAGDFLSDINVSTMSMSQRGIYITLLAYEWIEGSLPNNEAMLKKLCSNHPTFEEDWKEMKHCFVVDGKTLANPRLEKERKNMTDYRERMSKNGRKGAKARWDGKAIAEPSNKEVEDKEEVNLHDEFENEFWAIYPRRDSKKRAMEKYVSLRKGGAAMSTIIDGLKSYIKYWRSSGTEPAFIPMPSTWLNQERYNDELLSGSKTIKNLDLKKTFNWMCDACGHEKTSDRELKTSEKLCRECEEGFYYSKSSITHERAVVESNKKARISRAAGVQPEISSTINNEESGKAEFERSFNNMVNKLGA